MSACLTLIQFCAAASAVYTADTNFCVSSAACALSGRGGVGSAALELLPYDGENALDFARARAGLIPPDAFGALSYSFVLETRGEAALSFAPSVDDGQPLTDYAFSLALLRLR